MTTNQAGLGAGYNPYDTSNNFMEKWYKAATALDPRNSADAEKYCHMTGSPMHSRVVQSLITPQHGRLHYGNFNGLPSEWFYDFAQKNKDRFEEHVRSIGYEVDLADTPGLGKLSTLPDTLEFLEIIIPPEHNPGIKFRDAYSKSTSTDADNQSGQFRIQQASQSSPVENSGDTEDASGGCSHDPVEGHDSGHDHAHHNNRTPVTAETLRLRDAALAAFRLANEEFDLPTSEIFENDAIAQLFGLSKEKSEPKSVGTSSKTDTSSDISEYPSPYNRSPSIPGSHSTETPPFQAQPSQGSQKSHEDDGQPGHSRVGRAASLLDLINDSDSGFERVILKPISQKAKIHKLSRTFPELEGELASFIDHRQRKYKAKPPPPITTYNLGTKAKFQEDSNNSNGSKKLRHDDTRNQPAAPPSLDRAQSTAGSLRTSALRATALPSGIIKSPPAYAGQFNGLSLYDLYVLSREPMTIRNTPRNPVEAVFGSRTHANPMIFHPALPVLPASSYRRRRPHETTSPASHHHSRLFRLARIVDFSTDIHMTLRRAPAQEQLRTEIHRELANASLNGVSIGKYRYYQGHLTVEEYLEKGMYALGQEEPEYVPNATESKEEQEQEATDSDSSEDEKEPEQEVADSDASEDGEETEEETTDSDVSEDAKEQEQEQESSNSDASENEEEPEEETDDSDASEDEEDHEQGVADPDATEEDGDYEDDDGDNLSEESFVQVY
ncbi:hypothetical protein DV736_g4281, partial [Chaetothyriales sp. CBS 134916]